MAVGQTLLSRAKSLEDKLPTYLAICRALGRREQHKEAYDMGFDVLRTLGAIPKSSIGMKIRLVKDFIYVKRFFSKQSDTNILATPLLEDKRLETILELFATVSIHSYYCGALLDYLFTIFREIVISLTKGLSRFSGVAITGYSLMCAASDDMKGAHRFSHLAQEILDMTKAREQACFQLFLATTYIRAWRDPPNEILDLYERAHKLGMQSADFENALLSQLSGFLYAMAIGHSLADVEMRCSSVMKKLRLYNIKYVLAFAEEN